MPTPAERNALLFLAAVTLLGGGVRVARAVGDREPPTPAAERALLAQQAAVREAEQREREQPPRRARGRVPSASAPPVVRRSSRDARSSAAGPARRIDVDRASERELDVLPRIGPALARRIVASRDSLGPFGSLEALGRVRGVGPAMLETLREHVTFSGTPRPTSAAAVPRSRSRRPP